MLSGASGNPELPPSQSAQLDKYKALFDASNPDRATPNDTQTQAGTTPVSTAILLSAVPEEQESQDPSQISDLRGTKRSRADEDAEMADDGLAQTGDNGERTRLPKRRAVGANVVAQQSVTATQSSATQQNSGAAEAPAPALATGSNPAAKPPKSSANKLDTDENFLKAVNSTKRGKKQEDDFDREFNQLRITNPKAKKKNGKDHEPITEDPVGTATTVVDEAAVSRPWEAIDDFGDVGLRGNFMVVVEMDVERGAARSTLTARNQDDSKVEWVGKPNFKKFKKMVRIAHSFSTKERAD